MASKLPKIGQAIYIDPKDRSIPVDIHPTSLKKLGSHLTDAVKTLHEKGIKSVTSMAKNMAIDSAKRVAGVGTHGLVDHLTEIKDILGKFLTHQEDIKNILSKHPLTKAKPAPAVPPTPPVAANQNQPAPPKPPVAPKVPNPPKPHASHAHAPRGHGGHVHGHGITAPVFLPGSIHSLHNQLVGIERILAFLYNNQADQNKRVIENFGQTFPKAFNVLNKAVHTLVDKVESIPDKKFYKTITKEFSDIKDVITKEPPDYVGKVVEALSDIDELPNKIGKTIGAGISRLLNTMIALVLNNPLLTGLSLIIGKMVYDDIKGTFSAFGPTESVGRSIMGFFNGLIGEGYSNLIGGAGIGATIGAAIGGTVGGPVGWLLGGIMGAATAAISNAIFGPEATQRGIQKILGWFDTIWGWLLDRFRVFFGKATEEQIRKEHATRALARKNAAEQEVNKHDSTIQQTQKDIAVTKAALANAKTKEEKLRLENQLNKQQTHLANLKVARGLAQQDVTSANEEYQDNSKSIVESLQAKIKELTERRAKLARNGIGMAGAAIKTVDDAIKDLYGQISQAEGMYNDIHNVTDSKPLSSIVTSTSKTLKINPKTAILDYAGKKQSTYSSIAPLIAPQQSQSIVSNSATISNSSRSIMMPTSAVDNKMRSPLFLSATK